MHFTFRWNEKLHSRASGSKGNTGKPQHGCTHRTPVNHDFIDLGGGGLVFHPRLRRIQFRFFATVSAVWGWRVVTHTHKESENAHYSPKALTTFVLVGWRTQTFDGELFPRRYPAVKKVHFRSAARVSGGVNV